MGRGQYQDGPTAVPRSLLGGGNDSFIFGPFGAMSGNQGLDVLQRLVSGRLWTLGGAL